MIAFVGAGPGAEDLITVRGQNYLKEADVIIYAGSLVNPGLLQVKKEGCEVYNSAYMTLEEVLDVMCKGEQEGKKSCACIQGILVCTVQSGSRWMHWKRNASHMRCVRESAPLAVRRLH